MSGPHILYWFYSFKYYNEIMLIFYIILYMTWRRSHFPSRDALNGVVHIIFKIEMISINEDGQRRPLGLKRPCCKRLIFFKKLMQNVASEEEDKYTYKNHILKVKYCLIFPIFFIPPPNIYPISISSQLWKKWEKNKQFKLFWDYKTSPLQAQICIFLWF